MIMIRTPSSAAKARILVSHNRNASKLFNLADFDPGLSRLRIAQWHAQLDPLDSCTWLDSLPAVHREFDFAHAIHDYCGACNDFMAQLSQSVSWILKGSSAVPGKAQPEASG